VGVAGGFFAEKVARGLKIAAVAFCCN
jgi:hypothetical protein